MAAANGIQYRYAVHTFQIGKISFLDPQLDFRIVLTLNRNVFLAVNVIMTTSTSIDTLYFLKISLKDSPREGC